MINLKSLMTTQIIVRHAEYIVNISEIEKKLKKLSSEFTSRVTKEYLSEMCENIGVKSEEDLLEGLFIFIKKLIKEIKSLKKMVKMNQLSFNSDTDNIFIAPPHKLYERVIEIENNYGIATNVIIYDHKKKIKNSFSKLLLDAFGYNKFSQKGNDVIKYIELLTKLKSPNSSFYKVYNKSILINKICNEIRRYNKISDELKFVNEELICEIQKVNKKLKADIINDVVEIIQNSYEQCKCTFNNAFLTTDTYSEFNKGKKNSKWNAYTLVMSLGIKSCPYCNRQYITPVYREEGCGVRADLDHFYPKSRYPYLSMSLYNLIPCCKFCNSIKGDKEFNYKSYLHPYEHGFEDYLKFRYKPIKYLFTGSSKDEFKIVLESSEEIDEKKELVKKAENNMEFFMIEPLYYYHKDEVMDLIKKRLIYNKAYCDELKHRLEETTGKPITEKQLIEFIVSNIIDEDKLYERTLSKLYKDIVDQLGFFKEDDDFKMTENECGALKKLLINLNSSVDLI
ncbi:hypothetical protein EHE19_001055 [Ruminiclostridium herbifermentans]|uniref:HNH nuclease domain-containing protein n=1 Tax=Ruminiclostridium herbifermentans TaxID=2488810 RepID=A0A4U7JIJ4_9FIRM|nr:hypothetical protein [Ruminiclostridium herbifermentans]QNU67175.1 hypothetical protein EHE19_001055 [Ruminiclostridium herbifermentans]